MLYINVFRSASNGVKYEVLKTIIFYRVPLFKRKLLFIVSYCLYEQGLSTYLIKVYFHFILLKYTTVYLPVPLHLYFSVLYIHCCESIHRFAISLQI